MKRPKLVEEVTDEWVKEHFDLEDERKELNKEQSLGTIQIRYSWSTPIQYSKFIEEFNQDVEEKVKIFQKNNELPDDYDIFIRYEDAHTDDYYGNDGEEFELLARWTIDETDQQVVDRLKAKEKTRIHSKDKRKIEKTKKDEHELEQYERLKKKYGD